MITMLVLYLWGKVVATISQGKLVYKDDSVRLEGELKRGKAFEEEGIKRGV